MTIQDNGYLGQMDSVVPENEFNAQVFLVNQVLNGKWTLTIALVKAVHGGGLAGPPTVDVQPMVAQIDGFGNPTSLGVINGCPVFRLQGGAGAFIADPVAGDIGILACASRDISAVIKNKAPSNPGSFRTFSSSDGMYIGGLLGGTPSQYIQITPDGITLAVGDISVVISKSGVSIAGIDFATHVHSDVQTGSGDSGPPVT